MKITISVVLTMYNGSRFLHEQLESIRVQSRQADEVIICDDCSIDNSREVAQNYIIAHDLQTSWRLVCNPQNIGYTKNFINGVTLANGDVIVFSDQDDIWEISKLELVADCYERNGDTLALITSYTVIDEEGNNADSLYNTWRKGSGSLKCMSFPHQLKGNHSVGFALTVRKSFYMRLVPLILRFKLTFDVPVGISAAYLGGYYYLEKSLVKRRVHASNVSAPMYTLKSRLLNVQRHIEGRKTRVYLWQSFLEISKILGGKNVMREQLSKELPNLELTLDCLMRRRLSPMVFLLFKNNSMIGKFLIFVDIIVILFGAYKN